MRSIFLQLRFDTAKICDFCMLHFFECFQKAWLFDACKNFVFAAEETSFHRPRKIYDSSKAVRNHRFLTHRKKLRFFECFCFNYFKVWSSCIWVTCLNCFYCYTFDTLIHCFPECIKNNGVTFKLI